MAISFIVKKGVVPPEETWYEASGEPYWGNPESGHWDTVESEWSDGFPPDIPAGGGGEGPPPS